MALHAILYSSIFVRMDIFGKSIQKPKIAVALIGVTIFGTIGITSTKSFRRRAYSWFYKVHLIGSVVVLPLLFFHVEHIRIYVLESAAFVGLNALLCMSNKRKLSVNVGKVTATSDKTAVAHSGN